MATRPNKKAVMAALAEYGEIKARLDHAEEAFTAATATARKRYDDACAEPLQVLRAMRAEAEPRIVALTLAIESEMLKADESGTCYPLHRVSVPGVLAEVAETVTRRIAPEDWIDATPPKARDDHWYACLKVEITKVDKFFGQKFKTLVNTISQPRVRIRFTDDGEAAE